MLRRLFRFLVVLVVSASAGLAFASQPVALAIDDPASLPQGSAAVAMRLKYPGDAGTTIPRGVSFRRVSDNEHFYVRDVGEIGAKPSIAVFFLPAGKYELFSISRASRIGRGQAFFPKGISFEVLAGTVNYLGTWNTAVTTGTYGHDIETINLLRSQFPALVERLPFALVQPNQKPKLAKLEPLPR